MYDDDHDDRGRKVRVRGYERALARDRKRRKRAAKDMVVRGRSLKSVILPLYRGDDDGRRSDDDGRRD